MGLDSWVDVIQNIYLIIRTGLLELLIRKR